MKYRIKNLILVLFAAMSLGMTVSGCKNTAHGAGEDIEKVGEKIQDKTR